MYQLKYPNSGYKLLKGCAILAKEKAVSVNDNGYDGEVLEGVEGLFGVVKRNRDNTLRGTRGDINKDVADMFAAREERNPSVEHNHMVEAAYRYFLECTDVDTIKRLLKEVKENRAKAVEGNISA